MNRGPWLRLLCALTCAASTYPALAKDPKPTLSIVRIAAQNLHAPVEDEVAQSPRYRVHPDSVTAVGNRARLSIPMGRSTLFAITGKLTRRAQSVGPLDERHARDLGLKRSDSGKIYGAGIERSRGGLDFSAAYQYSKLRAGELRFEGQANADGLGRSHSVRATARIRFRP